MRPALLSLALLSFALSALVTSSAAADAIAIPQCPAGWEGRRVGHGGNCFPVVCASDAACSGGATCESLGRCWRRSMMPAGRRPLDPEDPSSYHWYPVEGSSCADTCPGAQECRVANECGVPAAPAAAAAPDPDPARAAEPAGGGPTAETEPGSGGGCSVLPGASSLPAGLAALALLALARRRR